MDDIDFFDKVDLKEVAKKTLIDIKDLEYLKNEEFDKLSKTKGLGFIKILEREYKVDLSDKKEKFLTYLKEQGKDAAKEFFIAPPKPPAKTFSKLIILILFFIVGVGILYILYLNIGYNTTSNQAISSENRVVKEAQNISGIKTDETNATEENLTKNVQVKSNISDANISTDIYLSQKKNIITVEKTEKKISKNISKEKNITTKINKVTFASSKMKKQIPNNIIGTKYVVTIVPKNRIWVGVIDLKSYKKKSYLRDTNITITKNNSYIIATGHGHFKIYYKDKIIDFNTLSPVRLLVKNGNVTQISKDEFIKLNKGKYW